MWVASIYGKTPRQLSQAGMKKNFVNRANFIPDLMQKEELTQLTWSLTPHWLS
jgi:hypothetical protein